MGLMRNHSNVRTALVVIFISLISITSLLITGLLQTEPVYAWGIPEPPENLTVTPVTDTKVTLEWQDKSIE